MPYSDACLCDERRRRSQLNQGGNETVPLQATLLKAQHAFPMALPLGDRSRSIASRCGAHKRLLYELLRQPSPNGNIQLQTHFFDVLNLVDRHLRGIIKESSKLRPSLLLHFIANTLHQPPNRVARIGCAEAEQGPYTQAVSQGLLDTRYQIHTSGTYTAAD